MDVSRFKSPFVHDLLTHEVQFSQVGKYHSELGRGQTTPLLYLRRWKTYLFGSTLTFCQLLS